MKNFILSTLFLVALSFVFAGCGKDDNPEPNNTNTEDNTEELALLIGSWAAPSDAFCTSSAATIFTYNQDGTYSITCDSDVFTANYTLSQDGKTLNVENLMTNEMEAWTVDTLTESSLVISRNGSTISMSRQQ